MCATNFYAFNAAVLLSNGANVLFEHCSAAICCTELYALVQVIRQILALRHLITFLIGVTLPPTVVHCDNNSVLLQLKRRDLSARSRHIRVHLGFIFDALEANEIDARFVRSGENPANAMTAAEDRDRFARSVDVMTGRPPEGPARDVRPRARAPAPTRGRPTSHQRGRAAARMGGVLRLTYARASASLGRGGSQACRDAYWS